MRYSKSISLFIKNAIEAYACGYNESDVMAQLQGSAPCTNDQQAAPVSPQPPTGSAEQQQEAGSGELPGPLP
eukprot:CAMPEP_0202880658 /NCGR_PEP_ID=MMETSP1391-20130828/35373_1 /ASSEMBLY_ACC=CAM_ASM_000867 /TAXON_ID=1034604 /ORGANISM="Chlamydomonas leiostraca, Strain SAG 11-49" /LENGTH=71 /DNA_ID=CAMNT_0049563193 /DNA_START=266 /DNA_END=478 /DNA_ORIENTATION=+